MQLDDRGKSGGGVDQHGIDTLAAADLALGLDGPGIFAGFCRVICPTLKFGSEAQIIGATWFWKAVGGCEVLIENVLYAAKNLR